jgi:hypothetical protein
MEHDSAVRANANAYANPMLHARLLVQEAMVRDFVSAAQHPPRLMGSAVRSGMWHGTLRARLTVCAALGFRASGLFG